MRDCDRFGKEGDAAGLRRAESQVRTLTAQLDESNPVLTRISDAMTAEADALLALKVARAGPAEAKALHAEVLTHRRVKEDGNQTLKEISERYRLKMKELRQH